MTFCSLLQLSISQVLPIDVLSQRGKMPDKRACHSTSGSIVALVVITGDCEPPSAALVVSVMETEK